MTQKQRRRSKAKQARVGGRRWTKITLEAAERDGWRCVWCGRPVHRQTDCPTGRHCDADHHGDHHPVGVAEGVLLGWELEQIDHIDNVVTSCRRCNLERSHQKQEALRRQTLATLPIPPGTHIPTSTDHIPPGTRNTKPTNAFTSRVGGRILAANPSELSRPFAPPPPRGEPFRGLPEW